MNYEKKLKFQDDVQLGKLNEDWFAKVGDKWLKQEQEAVLKAFANTPVEKLVSLQERYRATIRLMNHLRSLSNSKDMAERKLNKALGGNTSEGI